MPTDARRCPRFRPRCSSFDKVPDAVMTDSVLDRDRLAAELVALVSDLIAIPSAAPSGDFGRIAAYVAGWLRDAGYATETVAQTPGLENCVGRLGPGDGPSLGFAAQVDTAGVGDRSAWRTDPLAAGIEEGHVFGLGAGDAKGSLAVQLWLAREVARRG